MIQKSGSLGIITLAVKLIGVPIIGNLYAALDKTVAKNAAIVECEPSGQSKELA